MSKLIKIDAFFRADKSGNAEFCGFFATSINLGYRADFAQQADFSDGNDVFDRFVEIGGGKGKADS